MTQETRVLVLNERQAESLRTALDSAGMQPRVVPHARFSYLGDGIAATLYSSGKLVLQGRELDLFLQRFLALETFPRPSASIDDERIGTDEAGKGDYYGSLVVAAVYCSKDDIERLRRIRVADSKLMSDDAVARVGAAIEASTPHAVVELRPRDYNRRYARVKNVNKLLGEMHAEAILAVAPRTKCRRVLTDEFGDASHVVAGLGPRAAEFELETRPRAEAHVAVAAASVLARSAFLRSLRELSDEYAVDLPKGAGDPVERAAERVLAILGPDRLGEVAKLHFKTTPRVLGRFGFRT